jgi:serine/threonine protein kinase
MRSPWKAAIPVLSKSSPSGNSGDSTVRRSDAVCLPRIKGYEVIEKIGQGGMATVYKASCTSTGKVVAIKVLSEEMAAKPVLRKRFEQEIRAASQLEHPNIVATLDHGESDAGPYLVMEYVKGESLGERIERAGPLNPVEAVRLITQVARALEYAHQQGVIHRDVKPDNILVTPDGQARLVDFGTRPGTGLGTPNFIAPEQLTHAKAIDARCDVYGLGATLYTAVTGRLPFAARTLLQILKLKSNNELILPRQLTPSVSECLERTICRAMHPDRGQRPASCAEFLDELTERAGISSASLSLPATPAGPQSERSSRWLPKVDEAMVQTHHGISQGTDLIGTTKDTNPSSDAPSDTLFGGSSLLAAMFAFSLALLGGALLYGKFFFK